jgi:insulysin
LVTPMFSQVPNKEFQHELIAVPLFNEGSLPMFVQVEPLATLRQLQVSFPIEDYRSLYHTKPVSYLGNLVGHEGEGSLLSQLKAEGLAESLSAGAGLGWRGGALFSVAITLTEKGASDYDRVLQLLFAYMDMLRDNGPGESLYAEQSQLADLGFRFREKVNPMNYVSALAGGMHYYAPQDTLRGPYIMDDYQRATLVELLANISPDNALVTLDDNSVNTNQVSRYYQVPYASRPVDAQQLAAWRAEADSDDVLHLPVPNEFIAEDVSLVDITPNKQAVPGVALTRERQKIWFMQDDEFRLPKGATYINFRSPEVGQSAAQTAAAVLYSSLLTDQVNEFAYPARLAGLSFNFYKHAQGISLRMNGYNDKQAVLLQQLLDAVEKSSFEPQRFDNIRKDMIRSLNNTVAKRPSSQVIDDLREALLYGEWGEQALIAALEELDLADLRHYAGQFWDSATAEVMLYGNYDPEFVQRLSDMLATVIAGQSAPVMPDLKVLKLASGESLQYVVNVQHDDSVVAWYLQGDGNAWQDRAATALTAQIMKSGFFQQLRTEQQLGYVASVFAWPQMDVPGLVMLIQSPVADASAVANAMQKFTLGVEPDLDAAQFERHQAALVNEILRPDKNLWERAEFYWQSIARKQWDFNGREALAGAVKDLTLESWLAYYNRVFLAQRHSLQVVTPGKWDRLPQGEYQHYDSAEAIKEGHKVYIID